MIGARSISHSAAGFVNQIASMHAGRIVSPFKRIANTSGKESFAPMVKELNSMPPDMSRHQIEPRPMTTLVLSRMHS